MATTEPGAIQWRRRFAPLLSWIPDRQVCGTLAFRKRQRHPCELMGNGEHLLSFSHGSLVQTFGRPAHIGQLVQPWLIKEQRAPAGHVANLRMRA